MLKINGKIVTDVVYKGKRIERIYVGSKKYYDMYDGRISGYALGSGTLSINGNKYDYGAGYFDIHVGDTGNVSSFNSLFSKANMSYLSHIGLNTGQVQSMFEMFAGCSSLTSLDVSHFDTGQVQSMAFMFISCSSLTSLDVSHFDTSKVQSMAYMFTGCSSLTSLDVSHFDTSKVQNMAYMFNGCSSLTSLDVSHFDTSQVQNMAYMFNGCSSLTSLDVSHFDTSKVQDMTYMFYNCSSLTSLDVSHFDTGNLHSMDLMFYNCKNMRTLNIGNMDLSGLTGNMNRTFMGCSSLRSITGQLVGLKLSIDFGWSSLLDHDSAMMVINSAETVTTVQTVSFSSQTKALLSDEEKAILTNKGWTLA
jgi:surface protein